VAGRGVADVSHIFPLLLAAVRQRVLAMPPPRPFEQKHEFMSLREITKRPFPILERP